MVPSLWTVHMEMCEIQSLYKVVDLLLEQAISQRWKVGFTLGKNGDLVSNGYRISIGEAKPRMRELDCEESWAPKNWCFWTVVLEKALESPLDCKEIQRVSPEYPLEGLVLKLKLQYFGHLMRSADSFEKTLMLGKIEGGRWRGQ